MIKGLMITPPVIGRIAIGKMVERNGKRVPEKNDEFTITTQVQSRGQWVLHPLDEALRQTVDANPCGMPEGLQPSGPDGAVAEDSNTPAAQLSTALPVSRASKRSLREKMGLASGGESATAPHAPLAAAPTEAPARRKLRSIPVRVLFNDPSLNLRAQYTLFNRTTARASCVGDGLRCKRVTHKGVSSMPCPGPDLCAFGQDSCKPYGRLNLVIGDSDELGCFVFRTTGFNSIRTLTARLQYFAAVSGGHLASMPLELRLRGKSTAQSHRTAIYYADLVVRSGLTLTEAITQAKTLATQRQAAGFDQQALDDAARQGYANGQFEISPEEAADVAEFYPASPSHSEPGAEVGQAGHATQSSPLAAQFEPQGTRRQNSGGTHGPYA